ncbi:hypothetical protein DFA_11234 [Cavenderia fasciculata]|uniref:Uncharacterized protein n=1 Tax=Cavenderia fasciculata TaxID=261658 RepID=F4QFM0_CACFS|nr:uncharacterized protein DFA_11234 [Cavenderia fasciculata]EGG13473.1 hypothetical protein DFA_11234 [Cavenderia fasciculata]|eukprot:XP_004350177.1 hypothetical protein DFA_11234 [Cavenderia fasciculata]
MSSKDNNNQLNQPRRLHDLMNKLKLRETDEKEWFFLWKDLQEWCKEFRQVNKLAVREFFIVCGKPERPSFSKLLSKGGINHNPSSKPSTIGRELRDIVVEAKQTLPLLSNLSFQDKLAITEERLRQQEHIPVSVGIRVQTNQPSVLSETELTDIEKETISKHLKAMELEDTPLFTVFNQSSSTMKLDG